jgi:hypothetical protein
MPPTATSPGSPAEADPVEGLVEFLTPVVAGILRRIDPEVEEFTTVEFIEVLQQDPQAAHAYGEALRRWGEGERRAKMVVHGQVIPVAMRRTGLVEWLGFAHGVDDPYAVPGRWRLVGGDAGERRDRPGDRP